VAFGSGGEIYVADGYGNSRVVKFLQGRQVLKEWGKKGKGEGEFNLPHAICVDAGGRVYVGDREKQTACRSSTRTASSFSVERTGAPFGLFLTARAALLLADGRAHLARVLGPKGCPGPLGRERHGGRPV